MSGERWQYAARAAVMTMMGSFGGGAFGLLFTMVKNKGKAEVMELMNSVLGALVSITAGCFLYRAWEALVIGIIGGALVSFGAPLFDKMRVDDPVGASAVHGIGGIWGVVAVGLFADNPIPLQTTNGRSGLFKGGGWYLFGVQSLTAVCLFAWGLIVTMTLLWCIDKIIPLRMDPYMELLGADISQHRIRHGRAGSTRPVSALRPFHKSSIEDIDSTGASNENNGVHHRHEGNKKRGIFQIFTNKAFVDDQNQPTASTFSNGRFITTRTGNTDHPLHRTFESMVTELNGANGREDSLEVTKALAIPEGLKGRKYKDLTREEIEELGEINASQDRFRHRFSADDYRYDVDRGMTANIRWLD